MNRRDFISGCVLAGVAASARGLGWGGLAEGSTDSLKAHAANKGILYGAATTDGTLRSDAGFAEALKQQCSLLVAENDLTWAKVHPAPDKYNFGPADDLLRFALDSAMKFRGTALVWHGQLPSWVSSTATAANAKQLLTQHIQTVVGHYAGKMQSWDVVNEIVATWDKRPDGLRNSPWLQLLGPDYPAIAFQAARQADPKALLVWNQNHLEYESDAASRTAVLKLLESMLRKNVPVQALGIQSHLAANKFQFNARNMSNFLSEVSGMGLKILITELDVTDKYVQGPQKVVDQAVADEFSRYLAPVLDNTSVIAVLTWGLSDKYSWLQSFAPRDDKQPVRGLPLDADMKPTPAFYAIANAFDHAPKR